MSAILEQSELTNIHRDILSHPAWYGLISGLEADKMLRGRNRPYLYILRAGELNEGNQTDYYVSFILPDLTIRHQPFVITVTPNGWYYENAGAGGPYTTESIKDVLHLMMHCNKSDCMPLNKLTVR